MKLNPTPKVRLALYLVTLLGTPLVGYLESKGVIGSLEVAFWLAEVTVVSGMAAFNVTPNQDIEG